MKNAVPLNDTAWLTQGPPAKLLAVLDRDGEEARVVGGAVRNVLLGHPPGEIDVATTALPEEVVRRAAAAGFRPVPTGVEHGTVTVVIDGTGFEVTTLREDVETFGRKAKVRFGRSWQKDAERRDFTFNALSVSRDGTVHDPVGGIEDLEQHRVRFIGDPAMRIAEDYLRILRFFRFHAAYGRGAPDPDGLHACIVAREGLRKLSRERLRAELFKLLIAPRALWERLRLANVEHERLASMADGWWRIDPAIGESRARALLYRLGPARYLDRIVLAWARAGAEAADIAWRELATLPERWQAPVFPLKAADLIARGVPKGPQLGRALAAAEEKWISAGFPNDASALQRILDEAARGDEPHSGGAPPHQVRGRLRRGPGAQEN